MSSRDNTSRGDNVIRADFGRTEPVVQEADFFEGLRSSPTLDVDTFNLPDIPLDPLPKPRQEILRVLLRKRDGTPVFGGEFPQQRPVQKAIEEMVKRGIVAEELDFGQLPNKLKKGLFIAGQKLKRCYFPSDCAVRSLENGEFIGCVFDGCISDWVVLSGATFIGCTFRKCDFSKAALRSKPAFLAEGPREFVARFVECTFDECINPPNCSNPSETKGDALVIFKRLRQLFTRRGSNT